MSDTQSGIYSEGEELVARYLEQPRPDIKDLIMVQYAGLVERVARKFAGIESHEDMVQVGFIGLLNALEKFDPNNGVRFNTYATYLVAGEIKHYLRDRSQTIRQPAWLQELRHKVNRAGTVLQGQLGRVPTTREVADMLGVSEASVTEVYNTSEMLRVGSLDAALPGDDDATEADRLDAADFCPEQLTVEDRLVLENAMAQLRDLERQVLVLFHFDSLNQTEIAARLDISCNYVSHILRQSLSKLRKILTIEEENDRLLRRQVDSVDYDVVNPQTGVYTEEYFRGRLQEEIHRSVSNEQELGLVLVEFSGLESLRKFYGAQSEKDFLADAAEFLRSSVRRLDVVSHWGTNGFSIILPFTGANVGLVQQRLMRQASSWTCGRLGPKTPVAVTIGQARAPEDGKTVADLIKAAAPDRESSQQMAA